MEERKERIIREALTIEFQGKEIYQQAAEKMKDESAKAVFQLLANEEKKHIEYLEELGSTLAKGEKPVIETAPPSSLPEKIFTQDFLARIGNSTYEIAILSTGVLLEANSFQFYEKAAQEAETKEEKELYLKLKEWEIGHYHFLLRNLDLLRDEFWAQNKFAPF